MGRKLTDTQRYYLQQSLFVVAWIGVQVMGFLDRPQCPLWVKILIAFITSVSMIVALYLHHLQLKRKLKKG